MKGGVYLLWGLLCAMLQPPREDRHERASDVLGGEVPPRRRPAEVEGLEVVKKINDDGTTVMMVEQNAGVLGIADKAYVMEKGTLIFSGQGDEILNNEGIREAYLGA